jgi:hypothetical protein
MKKLLVVFAAIIVGMGLLISPASAETVKKLGSSYRFPDGLKITVSKAVRFTPDEYAMFMMGNKRYPAVKITYRLYNGTGKVYDPFMFSTSISSADREAGLVADSTTDMSPTMKILPGRSVTWTSGYTVKNPNDIVMQVSNGFGEDPVMFVS